MIPSVLPSPRADAPAEARPAGDDRGFDEALRRASGDASDARRVAGTALRDADDGEADASSAIVEADGARPRADEPAEHAPSSSGDEVATIVCPAPPAPAAQVATGHATGPAETAPASAAVPGAHPGDGDTVVDAPSLAAELGSVATTVGAGDTARATGSTADDGVGAAGAGDPTAATAAPVAPVDPADDAQMEVDAEPAHRAPGSVPADRAGDADGTASGDGGFPPAPAPASEPPAVDASRPAPAAPTSEPGADIVAAAAAAPAPAATGGATAMAPPAAAPAVAQQLVEQVTPLVEGPDGTHELTIELRPATLGRVQLEVTLEDGVLHVRVHAEDPASRRLLGQSLGDLRTALADAGISAGSLDVGDPGTGGGAPTADRGAGDRPGPHAGDGAPAPTRPTGTTTVRPLPDGRTALDVLL